MTVQLRIHIPKLKTTQEGQAYCSLLAQEIVELALNDDSSIARIEYSVPKKGSER